MAGAMHSISRIKEVAMQHFGFVTNRPSRMAEYSWILENLTDGEYVCDIGAGTSPVPIILAEDGWKIDTVDYWNEETADEWGFVNYHTINKNITSYNVDFSQYDEHSGYDAIYSISAIEHMPAYTRRAVFKRTYELLNEGCMFLATIDVRQGTDQIHNRNYGQVIEQDHGTVNDLLIELYPYFGDVSWYRQSFTGQGQDVLFIKGIK